MIGFQRCTIPLPFHNNLVAKIYFSNFHTFWIHLNCRFAFVDYSCRSWIQRNKVDPTTKHARERQDQLPLLTNCKQTKNRQAARRHRGRAALMSSSYFEPIGKSCVWACYIIVRSNILPIGHARHKSRKYLHIVCDVVSWTGKFGMNRAEHRLHKIIPNNCTHCIHVNIAIPILRRKFELNFLDSVD